MLKFQKELLDLNLKLSETHAGRKLIPKIKQLVKKQQGLIYQIREELNHPNNATLLQLLMDGYDELQKTSVVLESPVRSSYLMLMGANRDRDQLGFITKPKIT